MKDELAQGAKVSGESTKLREVYFGKDGFASWRH
jgi:hypothetical protein